MLLLTSVGNDGSVVQSQATNVVAKDQVAKPSLAKAKT